MIMYVGYDPSCNNSWIIETKGSMTYVIFQEHSYCRIIAGYVKEENNKYRAYNCMKTYDKIHKDKSEAVEFIKAKYIEKKGGESL